MLGLAYVLHPTLLAEDLIALHRQLLNDAYLKQIPSLHPEGGKTALAFHAKDDVPEVRKEVFQLLLRHEIKFFAVVRNKHAVVTSVLHRNERDATYRYSQNELYDALISRLFKERLHQHDEYRIHFAKRGSSDRTHSLHDALNKARLNFQRKWGVTSNSPIQAILSVPKNCVHLQATDYLLWALQRFYERREDRYLNYVWPKISLIHDVDDTRKAPYGVYYTQKNPLSLSVVAEKKPEI